MRTSSCLAISKVRAEMVALFVTELRTQSLVLGKGKKAFEERNEAKPSLVSYLEAGF